VKAGARELRKPGWTWRFVRTNFDLYLMILPALVLLFLFHYLPMYGASIAFKDFNFTGGILGSPWVGFQHFQRLFQEREFQRILRNTLLISFYRIVFQFPLPILLAILLNEVGNVLFKRAIQTVTYMPHFLSWVIVGSLVIDLLSPSSGLINAALDALGIPQITLMSKGSFRGIVVASQAWKETGWSAIIYLAAIMSINQELYEVSIVDGAGRLRQIWHITIPGILSTIVFILLLRIGSLMSTDVEQILMLYNPLVYETGDVIGTYVYRVGLGRMEYSYTTAIGLFQSVVGFLLLAGANWASRKYARTGLW
jgi:putative aldouronate transport system permease protein